MLRPLAAAFAACALTISVAASAQSAVPLGLWRGMNSGDALWIKPNTECSASGTVNVAGNCAWSATSTGGVLTMKYAWTIGPGYIYYSIRWLDRNTILVNNVERFVRVG